MSKEASGAPAPGAANRRWKRLTPLLLVLVGFGAGVLASHHGPSLRRHPGGRGEHRLRQPEDSDRRASRRRGGGSERGRRFRQQLVRRLDLDAAQQEQVDAFIEANRAEARAFWDDTYARYRELRLRFREQIREILTETQRETLEAWLSERERNEGDPGPVEDSPGGTGS